MKSPWLQSLLITAAVCVAAANTATAQGTLLFRVHMDGAQMVPMVDTPAFGGGLLELNSTSLRYNVGLDALWFDPTGAFIHGPAAPGSTGPLILDLGPRHVVPGPQGTVQFLWVDSFTVTQPQIEELLAGLWYVQVSSPLHPDGEIRGQIILYQVPEPATPVLFGLGVSLLVGRFWWRKGNRTESRQTSPLKRTFRSMVVLAMAGLLPSFASAQGTLEFRAVIPDDFECAPQDIICGPSSQGRLFLESDQVRYDIVYASVRYLPYVGFLHVSESEGLETRPFDLLAFGSTSSVRLPQAGGGIRYQGAIPLSAFTPGELNGLAAGQWQVRFSTPDALNDYLAGSFTAVSEPSVLGLLIVGAGGLYLIHTKFLR